MEIQYDMGEFVFSFKDQEEMEEVVEFVEEEMFGGAQWWTWKMREMV